MPGRPEMTDFRRRAALPPGAVARGARASDRLAADPPAAGGPRPRPVGSRLPLDYARETGANFLTAGALDAARARLAVKEPHQSFDQQRLWADLLSSSAMAFNLFGDLAADLALADRAVHTWWPDAPGTVCDVRFAHSPGRLDPAYLGNLGRVRRGVRARPRRRDAGDHRRRHQVPRPDQARAAEAEPADALPRDHRAVGHLRAGRDRRGQRHGADHDVARPPAGAVDAPARERRVELGPLRRRAPRRQPRTSPTRATATASCSSTTRPSRHARSRSCSTPTRSRYRRPRPFATATSSGAADRPG